MLKLKENLIFKVFRTELQIYFYQPVFLIFIHFILFIIQKENEYLKILRFVYLYLIAEL